MLGFILPSQRLHFDWRVVLVLRHPSFPRPCLWIVVHNSTLRKLDQNTIRGQTIQRRWLGFGDLGFRIALKLWEDQVSQ